MTLNRITLVLLLETIAFSPLLAQEPIYVIPLKPDPPFTIDGDLSDWSRVPNQFAVGDKAHCTYTPDKWRSVQDLSVKGHMAWRPGVLYVGLDITDDVISQEGRGFDMWKGDHVELYLDFNPSHEPKSYTFGVGQWQFGLSPGNFKNTGDPLTDLKPEIFCYIPAGHDLKGAQIAAKRTPTGYTLEAAIPFALLGVDNVSPGTDLNAEVAISDSDSPESKQEKMLTLSTDVWEHFRTRLRPMLFGDAQGKATATPRALPLRKEMTVKPVSEEKISFDSPPIPKGKEAYVFLRARIQYPYPAGFSANALKLTLNGTPLAGDRFTNRPLSSTSVDGRVHTLVIPSGEAAVWYSPSFEAVDSSPSYGLQGGAKACDFEYRVTDLLKPGGNVLIIQNGSPEDPQFDKTMIVGDLSLLMKSPPPPPPQRRPAPTGRLPVITPQQVFPKRYTARETDPATLEVKAGGEQYVIESRFSSPDSKWNRGSSGFFSHSRRVEQRDEAIIVFDTFKNLTHDDVPIMQRHSCNVGKRIEKAWLAGLSPAANNGSIHDPGNPSSYALTKRSGLGLLALNDEFMVHVNNSCLDGVLALSDTSFVLRAGATYTAEWAIVPTSKPDFWSFVNAARRLIDVNFTLPRQFAFMRVSLSQVWKDTSDEAIKSFVSNKGAQLVAAGEEWFYHGTLASADHKKLADYCQRLKRLVPTVTPMLYFHCFGSTQPGDIERFAADRVLDANGRQIDYGGTYSQFKIFFPTTSNAFGRTCAHDVDLILGECAAEGVYWDETEYSVAQYHYGEPWDGVSGDIDPTTFKLVRKKSSVSLLSQEYRIQLMKRILQRGPILANGMPFTRSVARVHFQRFTETGSIANCAGTLLYTPVALGDSLSERTEEDCYRCMLAALDYGCLYNWYSDSTVPTHKTLATYMFPFTPMELHEGYVIGKERIVTKVSGLFGWGDSSRHSVRVFNEKGEEVSGFKAPLVKRWFKTHTELRIPEGWSAVIIRTHEGK